MLAEQQQHRRAPLEHNWSTRVRRKVCEHLSTWREPRAARAPTCGMCPRSVSTTNARTLRSRGASCATSGASGASNRSTASSAAAAERSASACCCRPHCCRCWLGPPAAVLAAASRAELLTGGANGTPTHKRSTLRCRSGAARYERRSGGLLASCSHGCCERRCLLAMRAGLVCCCS